MTSKTDFSKEEWFLLHSTPAMVGMVVLGADYSGILGTTKEMMAVSKGMVAGATQYPYNPLIQALLREKEGPEGERVKDSYKDLKKEVKQRGSIEQLTADVLESCGKVAGILEEKATAGEAGEYKAWVMLVADKVANASKERSSKGTERGKVSVIEEALIKKIADALGVESSAKEAGE